jgi:hypothetical protein
MLSIKSLIVRLFVTFFVVTLLLVILPIIYSGSSFDLIYIARLLPAAMLLSIIVNILYGVCAYCRRESRDGWIIEDSSSEKNIRTV